MNIISFLLRKTLYQSLSLSGFFRFWREKKNRKCLTIITYHGVLPSNYKVNDQWFDGNLIDKDEFRQHVRFLKSNYNVISPDEFYLCLEHDYLLPEKAVLITCDDGLLNNVTDMLPILKEEALKCIFFVTTASLNLKSSMLWLEELYLLLKLARNGPVALPFSTIRNCLLSDDITQRRDIWSCLVKELCGFDYEMRRASIDELRKQVGLSEDWEKSFEEDPILRRRFLLLSKPDLELLLKEGMTLGSHTCSHPILAVLKDRLAQYEIEESRHRLENELGIKVWALAYPFGDPLSVTSREIFLAERSGYKCAVINYGGLAQLNINNLFQLPRIHISSDMTLAEFDAHVSGFHGFLKKRIACKKV